VAREEKLMNRAASVVLLVLASLLAAEGAEHHALLPRPQEVRYGSGHRALRGLTIRFSSPPSVEDRFAANELSSALSAAAQSRVAVVENASPGRSIVLTRTGNAPALPGSDERGGSEAREAYTIKVTQEGVEVRAKSSAGLFYGIQTLRQLVEGAGEQAVLPEVEITDWPSLAYRGFMMDTNHGALLTEEEIKRQLDFLARWKANQYYFYSEANIEVRGYPLVNLGARYSQEQIKRIIDYARQRHIDVVPCMEFFGHMHDVFRVEEFSDMSPLRYGGEFNPRDPRVHKFLEDWLGQMAALFPSPWFHIGFDEPWALELFGGPAAGVPPGELFMEHLKNVAAILSKHNKRMMFWADMMSGARIFSRYPELISQLPKGTIAVPWHYRVEKDFTPIVEPLAKAGLPIVVAPAVWNWNEVSPSFLTSFANISGLLAVGRKYGAIGLLNTGWSDDAQIIYRMSLPGMAYGAVAAWQSTPVDQDQFFSDYAIQLYSLAVADEAAAGLASLAKSQEAFSTALGGPTMLRFWDDPFEPARLKRLQDRESELRQARLWAGEAEAHFAKALDLKGDPASLSSLLLGARMLDHLGMKNLYAVEIARYFQMLGPGAPREKVNLLLRIQTASHNHGLIQDLMDSTTELKELYRQAWLAEYQTYRLGTALEKWDAEFQYWWKMQKGIQDVIGGLESGEPVPPLEAFRPKH
jgi:hexosaminidase